MIKILILADDMTGAVDTGVKFAAYGAYVKVSTDRDYNFLKDSAREDVLVISTETRHIPFQEAYEIIYHIVKNAIEAGINYIYKKTDSALRGNIGSELAAVLEASGETVLPFLPAYPLMNRVTVNGIHSINGVPVHLSEFGKDPFEPVVSSYVSNIIHSQSEVPTETIPFTKDDPFSCHEEIVKGIYIFDAETDEDMLQIANALYSRKKLTVMAGCAGFASILPKLLHLEGNRKSVLKFKSRFLMVCGSVNKITGLQLDYAEGNGFLREHLSLDQKTNRDFFETKEGKASIERLIEICKNNSRLILDTGDAGAYEKASQYARQHNLSDDDVRVIITENMAYITEKVMAAVPDITLMITGGDTLTGFLKKISCKELIPICELEPGTVLSRFYKDDKEYQVISKSGGFGDKELIVKLADNTINN
jgi:uncharacterized protein YgbK (DUF1537 family)